jgi:uncharacterized protein with PIN domain
MRLLLDEDSMGRALVRELRAAGHDVETVNEADMVSHPDEAVFAHAKRTGRVLVTRNTDDFLTLHETNSEHPGILAEYQDSDPAKNMTYSQVVAAIGKIEASGWDIQNEFVVLNAWR